MTRTARAVWQRIPVQRNSPHTQADTAPVPRYATEELRAQLFDLAVVERSRLQVVEINAACSVANITREHLKCMVCHPAHLTILVLEPRDHNTGVLHERRRLKLRQCLQGHLAHVPRCQRGT